MNHLARNDALVVCLRMSFFVAVHLEIQQIQRVAECRAVNRGGGFPLELLTFLPRWSPKCVWLFEPILQIKHLLNFGPKFFWVQKLIERHTTPL